MIEELTDIQKQSEDAAMNEMHGYMSDTKYQFENMRKKLKDKEMECGRYLLLDYRLLYTIPYLDYKKIWKV